VILVWGQINPVPILIFLLHTLFQSHKPKALYIPTYYYWEGKTKRWLNMFFNPINNYFQQDFGYRSYLDGALPLSHQFYLPLQNLLSYSSADNDPEPALPLSKHRASGGTLDDIISDPLDRFLAGKKDSLLELTKGIMVQIYERTAIRDNNFSEIDQRVSRANSILDTLSIFYLGANMVVDKRKAIIEKELMAFEQERRFEAVSCWRDISRLKLQLGEIGQQIDNHMSRDRLMQG
jgi:hypothetical protein